MKKIAAAVLAGLLAAGGQGAALAQPSGGDGPGTRPYCNAQWRDMVAAGTTGNQTRTQFMQHCLADRPREGAYFTTGALVLGGVAAGLIALEATSSNNDHPASP
ncbi:MAG TPA: hypothetical protein VII63_04695 [Caulobacteraceae bacterium]